MQYFHWGGHGDALLHNIANLYECGQFVDCTLSAEGQYLKAHKVILCASSPYLQMLLMQGTCKEAIALKGIKFLDLKNLVSFVYNGQIEIAEDQVSSFIRSAKKLKIAALPHFKDNKKPDADNSSRPSSINRSKVPFISEAANKSSCDIGDEESYSTLFEDVVVKVEEHSSDNEIDTDIHSEFLSKSNSECNNDNAVRNRNLLLENGCLSEREEVQRVGDECNTTTPMERDVCIQSQRGQGSLKKDQDGMDQQKYMVWIHTSEFYDTSKNTSIPCIIDLGLEDGPQKKRAKLDQSVNIAKREMQRKYSKNYRDKQKVKGYTENPAAIEQKRQRARERVRKYRERKKQQLLEEQQELGFSTVNQPEIERKRQMARQRDKKYREKKKRRLEEQRLLGADRQQQMNEALSKTNKQGLEMNKENQAEIEQKRQQARERVKKYRERKKQQLVEEQRLLGADRQQQVNKALSKTKKQELGFSTVNQTEIERKRQMARQRDKKYREKKKRRLEEQRLLGADRQQQMNEALSKTNKQGLEMNKENQAEIEKKRQRARERVKKYRERKKQQLVEQHLLGAGRGQLVNKSLSKTNKQGLEVNRVINQAEIERKRQLARQRCKKYQDKKKRRLLEEQHLLGADRQQQMNEALSKTNKQGQEMNKENQTEIEQKKQRARERVKKYRERKKQQLVEQRLLGAGRGQLVNKSLSKTNKQGLDVNTVINQAEIERKRQMARQRDKKYREKKKRELAGVSASH